MITMRMKKLLSILLVTAMLASMAVTAFAEGEPVTPPAAPETTEDGNTDNNGGQNPDGDNQDGTGDNGDNTPGTGNPDGEDEEDQVKAFPVSAALTSGKVYDLQLDQSAYTMSKDGDYNYTIEYTENPKVYTEDEIKFIYGDGCGEMQVAFVTVTLDGIQQADKSKVAIYVYGKDDKNDLYSWSRGADGDDYFYHTIPVDPEVGTNTNKVKIIWDASELLKQGDPTTASVEAIEALEGVTLNLTVKPKTSTPVTPDPEPGDNNTSTGGGSSSSNEDNTPANAPSANVGSNGAVSAAKISGDAKKAVSNAKNGKANVNVTNAKTVSTAALNNMAKAAAKEDVALTMTAKTTDKNGVVVASLKFDATKAAEAVAKAGTKEVKLGVELNTKNTKNVTSLFKKWFKNKNMVTVKMAQKGEFGFTVEAAVKVDLKNFNKNNLKFYSYDAATNTYKEIETKYTIDSKGLVHFNTTVGNYIIITDAPIASK